MPSEPQNLIAALEAFLFVHGEPLSIGDVAETLKVSEDDVRAAVAALGERLHAEDRGLALLSHGEKVQLTTKPAFAHILEHFVKRELSSDLTPAALETLSLIAYLGPLSRAKIEYHRGVNSAVTLRNLLLRGLVSRIPDPERPTAHVYEASFDFLKHLGLLKQSDLPEYEKFHTMFSLREERNGESESLKP